MWEVALLSLGRRSIGWLALPALTETNRGSAVPGSRSGARLWLSDALHRATRGRARPGIHRYCRSLRACEVGSVWNRIDSGNRISAWVDGSCDCCLSTHSTARTLPWIIVLTVAFPIQSRLVKLSRDKRESLVEHLFALVRKRNIVAGNSPECNFPGTSSKPRAQHVPAPESLYCQRFSELSATDGDPSAQHYRSGSAPRKRPSLAQQDPSESSLP